MKIYFAGSIRGGRADVGIYMGIIEFLQKYGEVLTEHVGDPTLHARGEERESTEIYERDMSWLESADVVIAEVTTPSLGVGYEIAKAENKKPVLCLFREGDGKRLSAMLDGNPNVTVKSYSTESDSDMEMMSGNPHILVKTYITLVDVEKIVGEFFENLK